jgi:adenylate cyclase
MGQLDIKLYCGGENVFDRLVDGPLELGRQQAGERGPFELIRNHQGSRLVIAPAHMRELPRRILQVDAAEAQLSVTNLHAKISLNVTGHGQLPPGSSFHTDAEFLIELPHGYAVRLRRGHDLATEHETTDPWQNDEYRSLATNPRIPLTDSHRAASAGSRPQVTLKQFVTSDEAHGRAVVDLLKTVLQVVLQSAGSAEFFQSAARAAAEIVELDRAMVLLRHEASWQVVAEHHRDRKGTPKRSGYSESLLRRMLNLKRTILFEPKLSKGDSMAKSLMHLDRAVASPLLDERGEIVGAVFGERCLFGPEISSSISDLEGTLVEILAGAIASGLARQREMQARGNLEQYFSHRIARQIQADPQLLTGQDAEVTVLFCDIRGFSGVTEKLGPTKTIEWINDVLTELSECVLHHDGVLVDYVGDELMAMWGAPGEQPDHAFRAISAGSEMLRKIQPLRERWGEILPSKFGFGIGINTGMARVGNTGSRVKFKYGPLGNTVNLGSRVQGASKVFGVAALATESVIRAAPAIVPLSRKLAAVRVLGIDEVVDLYEIVADPPEGWESLRVEYASALDHFQNGRFSESAKILGALIGRFPEDNPTLLLLSRAIDALAHPKEVFNPVLSLDHK